MGVPKREEVAELLSRFLADSYLVYLKTQNYHWNVTGPQFFSLHAMFEEQYTDLAAAVDEIAERIRALKVFAPGSFQQFQKLSQIEEAGENVPDAATMVAELAGDQEKLADAARNLLISLEGTGDEATVDLATQRLAVHEKNAWMLRSSA